MAAAKELKRRQRARDNEGRLFSGLPVVPNAFRNRRSGKCF